MKTYAKKKKKINRGKFKEKNKSTRLHVAKVLPFLFSEKSGSAIVLDCRTMSVFIKHFQVGFL